MIDTKKASGLFSVFGIVFIIIIILFLSIIINNQFQDVEADIISNFDFSTYEYNIKDSFCQYKFNKDYEGTSESKGFYCTNTFDINTKQYLKDDEINKTEFLDWFYNTYKIENPNLSVDLRNRAIDIIGFFTILLHLFFSIYAAVKMETISNRKMLVYGIMGVPIFALCTVILYNMLLWIMNVLFPQMFMSLMNINILINYPMLNNFFTYMYYYLLPYAGVYIISLAANFNELKRRYEDEELF